MTAQTPDVATARRPLVTGAYEIGIGVLAGTLLYEGALRLLTVWNVAVWRHGRDPVRDVVLWLFVAVVVALLVVRRSSFHPRATRAATVGGVLLGAGIAWVAWGVVDQHVLRLFDVSPAWQPILWDSVFHGVGAVVAGIGWMLWSESS